MTYTYSYFAENQSGGYYILRIIKLDENRNTVFNQFATSGIATTLTFAKLITKILYFSSGIIAVSETVTQFYIINFASSGSSGLLTVGFDATSSSEALVGLFCSEAMQLAGDFYALTKYITVSG